MSQMSYVSIKSGLIKLIPRSLLFKLEPTLRFFYSLSYRGDTFECTICNTKLKTFLATEEELCPRCGSMNRTRRLYQLVKEEFLSPNSVILDFSPSRSLYRKFKQGPYNYTASDLSGDFIADVQFDITNIEAPESNYDLILCYHILEHIPEDTKAIKELYRVLKPGGQCIIQTPFKDGAIYEDIFITTEEGRLKHFGQKDHVRIYSVQGLVDRLTAIGFEIDTRNYTELKNNRFGFQENETVLICRKKEV